MASGSVVRFDEVRGYGFITPDGGEEDVFVHANDLLADKGLFKPGTRVEFEISDSDRGLKASAVRIVGGVGDRFIVKPVARVDDDLCDVLSVGEFTQEVTEAVIVGVPSVTGQQITQLRKVLMELARRHGWIDS